MTEQKSEGLNNVNEMTRQEFCRLPHRKWDEEIICDSLIILPASFDWFGLLKYHIRSLIAKIFHLEAPPIYSIGHLHDSGFRCMDFVAVKDDKPICLLSGCSDVMHINGIGGFGHNWLEKYDRVPDAVPPIGWNIDCLARSGLLRIFSHTGRILCDRALSSFDFYHVPKDSE